MSGRLLIPVLVAAACCAAPQRLRSDDRPAATPAADAQVEVIPLAGSAVRGMLTALNDQTVSVRDLTGAPQSWKASDIRSLRGSQPRSGNDTPPVILLTNGDSLRGDIIAASEDVLEMQWTAVDPPLPVSIPLEFVRSFAIQQPEDELDRLRLHRIWTLLEPQADRLISTDLTHLDGEFLGIVEAQVRIKAPLGEFAAPLTEVIAVIMNSELVTSKQPEGSYAVVTLTDGSRVTMQSLQLTPQGLLQGLTLWGGELAFPVDRLARVLFFDERIVDLANLEPAEYEFVPYLTQQFPLVHNRNVHGGRLRLRDELFATGLGVSTKSIVTYDLTAGAYLSFDVVVGVDDMTEGQGNVVFIVEVDGKRVYESAQLTGRSPRQSVGPIDVQGAERLTLIADFGGAGNIQDVADWCEPVLINSPRVASP